MSANNVVVQHSKDVSSRSENINHRAKHFTDSGDKNSIADFAYDIDRIFLDHHLHVIAVYSMNAENGTLQARSRRLRDVLTSLYLCAF